MPLLANPTLLLILLTNLTIIICGVILYRKLKTISHDQYWQKFDEKLLIIQERLKQIEAQRDQIQILLQTEQQTLQEQRNRFDEYQINSLKMIQDSLQKAVDEMRTQITNILSQHSEHLSLRVNHLTQETQQHLKEIAEVVDKQLSVGFEKTTATFTDIIKRLAIIDQAQKKITELSNSVVSLQEILTDKRSRGAFGEVQLNSLIRNMIPENHFELQHTFSNGKRADCILFLPKPSGNIAIDAKFPLESYRLLHDQKLSEHDRKQVEQQFKIDIRKHIQNVAEKYIIPEETADGAMLFIPAEAIFAEIHAYYPDLIDFAHKSRVWLVSPTTMMAVLTTARAVLKDAATRKQVHLIQEHLIALSKDFSRFGKRMDNLAKHINQAHQDVEQVHQSSQKISKRFNKIEQVDLGQDETVTALELANIEE